MYNEQLTNKQYEDVGNQVDVLTQNNLKDIPRNRLVRLDGTPFDVHSLHTYFSMGTTKHPIFPGQTINRAIINQIKNKALATGWKSPKEANKNNVRVPSHLQDFSKRQARGLSRGRKMQRRQQAAHILDNNRNAMAKVERISRVIVGSNLRSDQITVPREQFSLTLDRNKSDVTGIQMQWGPFGTARLFPLAETNFGLMPRPAHIDRLNQAFWVLEAPKDSRVPGTTKNVRQMSESLAALMDLPIEQIVTQNPLIDDIRSRVRYVDEETRGRVLAFRIKEVLSAVRGLDLRCARGRDCSIHLVRKENENGMLIMKTDDLPLRSTVISSELVKNLVQNNTSSRASIIFDIMPLDMYVALVVTKDDIDIRVVDA